MMEENESEQVAALQEELQRARADAAELRQMLEASLADFRGYKRRIEAEREAARAQVNRDLILRLLPLLDDLQRALAGLPEASAQHPWVEGIRHIERKFRTVLEAEGLRPVGALGLAFDPEIHEAVGEVERDDMPPGHIAEVVRQGYRLADQLLRPAQVIVARKPAAPTNRLAVREYQREGTSRANRPDYYNTWMHGGRRWPRY